MYVTDSLVYLQLQKTGCSHIAHLLGHTLGGRQVGRHQLPGTELRKSSRVFISSIRNPWDWYVSLWSYGCDGKGGFAGTVKRRSPRGIYQAGTYKHLATAIHRELVKQTGSWRRCYADSGDPHLFRHWISMVLDPAFRFDFGEGYGQSAVHHLVGIYGYRFLRVSCLGHRDLTHGTFSNLSSLAAFNERNSRVSRWIRNERLEQDFIDTVTLAGASLSEEDRHYVQTAGKRNTSTRSHKTGFYYDDRTASLVGEREKLIVDRFGYGFPD